MPRTRLLSPNNNRTDLNTVPLVKPAGQPNGAPNVQPTGLPYGEGVQLHNAQAQVPITNPGVSAPPSQPNAPTQPAAPPGQAPDMGQALADAKGMAPPQGSLTQPTMRPGEPITAGMATGPGAGVEALNGMGAPQAAAVGAINTLNTLAAMPNASADVRQLAAYATHMMGAGK